MKEEEHLAGHTYYNTVQVGPEESGDQEKSTRQNIVNVGIILYEVDIIVHFSEVS